MDIINVVKDEISDDHIKYIADKTGVDTETIIKVLKADIDYCELIYSQLLGE